MGWAVAMLALSCVPYLVAVWLAPDGWHFAGIIVNPLDGHSYLAKMRQGFDGAWRFHLPYTPEPHQGVFIYPHYLALGHLARLTGLPLVWMFHLARLAAGLALLMAAYRFILRLAPDRQTRRLAFILLLTASGLGWLGVLFGAFPIDLWIPEAFVPYSLLTNPHFPLGMALMLVILGKIGGMGDWKVGRLGDWGVGLTALGLAVVLPFGLLTVWAVLAVWLGWQTWSRRQIPLSQLRQVALTVLFGGPVIGYDYWVSVSNPAMAAWSAQNITPAPPPVDVLLGYGPLGLAALLGGWHVVRQKNRTAAEWLVVWWAVVTLGLVYLPFNLQRRLITGLHIPLVILAAVGLTRGLHGHRYQRAAIRGVVGLSALGTVAVWTLPLLGLLSPPTPASLSALFFLRQDERQALEWLDSRTGPEDVVLASPRLGIFVPEYTGARTFYGHPFETIDARNRQAQATAFFRGEIETVTPVPDFIIYGPSERALGKAKGLARHRKIFEIGETAIYEVTK